MSEGKPMALAKPPEGLLTFHQTVVDVVFDAGWTHACAIEGEPSSLPSEGWTCAIEGEPSSLPSEDLVDRCRTPLIIPAGPNERRRARRLAQANPGSEVHVKGRRRVMYTAHVLLGVMSTAVLIWGRSGRCRDVHFDV